MRTRRINSTFRIKHVLFLEILFALLVCNIILWIESSPYYSRQIIIEQSEAAVSSIIDKIPLIISGVATLTVLSADILLCRSRSPSGAKQHVSVKCNSNYATATKYDT